MKVVIFYHPKEKYTLSYPVMFMYNAIKMNKSIFHTHMIEIIDILSFLKNTDQQTIEYSNINSIEIDYISYLHLATQNLVNIMKTTDIYDNSILLGFQNAGSDPLFYRKGHCSYDFYDVFKEKKCKLGLWMDDLHGFPNFPKIDTFNDSANSVCTDYRLDLCDFILTPSLEYFKNINSQYLSKTHFYFYNLNENFYNKLCLTNWNQRNNKILLSGACGISYPIRNELYNIYQYNKYGWDNLIEYLHTPGYNRTSSDFDAKTGLNYYMIINKYKAAFFGYASKPLNFNLAKIIEILMCGTLGFFEYSPLLESELGLVKFVHYVPMTDDNGILITDKNYYLEYLNSDIGNNIAITGALYVRNNYASTKCMYDLINILRKYENYLIYK